jgi:hypothetical protein
MWCGVACDVMIRYMMYMCVAVVKKRNAKKRKESTQSYIYILYIYIDR